MRAYLPKSFRRDATNDGISEEDCKEAIRKAERGLIDARLGGELIKQRIPRGNRGAAKGSRAVIFYKRGEVAVFLHIFSKGSKANLSKSELAIYVDFASEMSCLSDVEFRALCDKRGWKELEI